MRHHASRRTQTDIQHSPYLPHVLPDHGSKTLSMVPTSSFEPPGADWLDPARRSAEKVSAGEIPHAKAEATDVQAKAGEPDAARGRRLSRRQRRRQRREHLQQQRSIHDCWASWSKESENIPRKALAARGGGSILTRRTYFPRVQCGSILLPRQLPEGNVRRHDLLRPGRPSSSLRRRKRRRAATVLRELGRALDAGTQPYGTKKAP